MAKRTYRDWFEGDPNMRCEYKKVGRVKVVCITDGLYAWLANERDFAKALDKPIESDTPYDDFCAIVRERVDLVKRFEAEYGPRQWANVPIGYSRE